METQSTFKTAVVSYFRASAKNTAVRAKPKIEIARYQLFPFMFQTFADTIATRSQTAIAARYINNFIIILKKLVVYFN